MTVVANEVTEETRARPWGPPGHHKGLGFNFKLAGGDFCTFGCTTARGPTSAPTAARPSPGPITSDDTEPSTTAARRSPPPPPTTTSEGAFGDGEEDTADLGYSDKKDEPPPALKTIGKYRESIGADPL